MKQITDGQLMAMTAAGDSDAFSQLLKRYEAELYNFLLRFLGKSSLAEDVFQDTFLQVHLSAKDFDTSRRFKPWLFTIAANKARDLLRSQARRPAMQITSADDDGTDNDLWSTLLREETTPADILDDKLEKELVRNTVMALPENLREILIMAYFQQLSYKDMAEALDIPLGTVKSRLHSAVAAFAKKYKEAQKLDD